MKRSKSVNDSEMIDIAYCSLCEAREIVITHLKHSRHALQTQLNIIQLRAAAEECTRRRWFG